jgi:hypothetical protein
MNTQIQTTPKYAPFSRENGGFEPVVALKALIGSGSLRSACNALNFQLSDKGYLSLVANGKRQPSPRLVLALKKHFGIAVADYGRAHRCDSLVWVDCDGNVIPPRGGWWDGARVEMINEIEKENL